MAGTEEDDTTKRGELPPLSAEEKAAHAEAVKELRKLRREFDRLLIAKERGWPDWPKDRERSGETQIGRPPPSATKELQEERPEEVAETTLAVVPKFEPKGPQQQAIAEFAREIYGEDLPDDLTPGKLRRDCWRPGHKARKSTSA
jgi:hypothetical protein